MPRTGASSPLLRGNRGRPTVNIVSPVIMSGLPAELKRFAKRSRASVVAGRITVERSRDVRRLLGKRDGPMGATHRRFDLEGSVDYVDRVFEDYLRYGSIDPGDLRGSRVLELGPGDNLGVALRFAAAGADVVAADRFIPYRDRDRERQVYETIVGRLPEDERRRVASVLTDDPVTFDGVAIDFRRETPIEAAPRTIPGTFDLIVSRAVLEHVYDLDAAFAAMDEILRPGGRMVHKVDLNDHGLFTGGGQNPLTFLTVGDRLYGWMGEESAGLPNRRLIGWYRSKLDQLGYECEYLVTHVAGVPGELEPHVRLTDDGAGLPRSPSVAGIRPRLLARYRDLSELELSIAGFMLAARKPAT
jgi:SAM-dependent methyltransferase